MPSQRRISWSSALADLRADRAERSDIREMRLRSPLRDSFGSASPLTGWRGKSGTRYTASVHDVDASVLVDARPAVVIAVRRDGNGDAHIVDLMSALAEDIGTLRAWIVRTQLDGANELHVHKRAGSSAERAAVLRDLTADVGVFA